jgi:tryptophanyl-tRNA synthetase
MSKSEGDQNAIYLSDEPEAIRKKIMRAVTDAGPTEENQPKPQPIENIFQLMKSMSYTKTPNTSRTLPAVELKRPGQVLPKLL